ncbi:Major Facilitator Superfamily protein [Actinacidiphila paucisporea]|uniref:Major Facilitator Superfamily protein n=1 Tax=Actinacidiphila paucisporea TaxID=310782 RepID=A0A1M7Q9N9_9ACTN|nr:Major Facilitator Superfamily protein [Actinacidiphila paucisporea]
MTALGDGLWFSMWAIYLTSVQGVPPATMGLAMGLGGGIGLLAAFPVGTLTDRLGARETLLAVTVLRAVFALAFLATHTFWPLLVAAALFTSMETAAKGTKVALVHLMLPEEDCLPVLARARVVQHLLYAAGAGAAAWVLSRQSAAPYQGAVVVNSLTFVVSAATLARLPRVPPVPAARRQASTAALRDFPFIAIMSSTAVLALCWALLSSGLPLWLKEDTAAPVWIAPLSVLVSSLLIALFQVRVTRSGRRLAGAVRSSRRAGAALAGCCLVFAAASWPARPAAAAVVVLSGLGLHVVGELHYVAARWGLSVKLMAHGAQGQYQAVAAMTEGGVVALGPALVTTLVIDGKGAGWSILALAFLTCTLPVARLCRSALRRTSTRSVRENSPA